MLKWAVYGLHNKRRASGNMVVLSRFFSMTVQRSTSLPLLLFCEATCESSEVEAFTQGHEAGRRRNKSGDTDARAKSGNGEHANKLIGVRKVSKKGGREREKGADAKSPAGEHGCPSQPRLALPYLPAPLIDVASIPGHVPYLGISRSQMVASVENVT